MKRYKHTPRIPSLVLPTLSGDEHAAWYGDLCDLFWQMHIGVTDPDLPRDTGRMSDTSDVCRLYAEAVLRSLLGDDAYAEQERAMMEAVEEAINPHWASALKDACEAIAADPGWGPVSLTQAEGVSLALTEGYAVRDANGLRLTTKGELFLR